jgi:hypothetical protein
VHHEDAHRVGVLHGGVHHLLVRRILLAKAHVDHVGPVFGGVANGVGHVLVPLVAVGHRADGHEADAPGDTVDPNAVLAHGPDDSGDVCAVGRIGAHHVVVAVSALRLVRVVIAHDGTRVEVRVVVVLDLSL